MLNDNFKKIFPRKALIGMIHLAGSGPEEKVSRAIDEIQLYQDEGLDAALIENYHADYDDVIRVFEKLSSKKVKRQIFLVMKEAQDQYQELSVMSCNRLEVMIFIRQLKKKLLTYFILW